MKTDKTETPESNDKELGTPVLKESKAPKETPITIPLDVYCDGLDQEGAGKFAKTMIQGAINAGDTSPDDKTREEWESIYLKLKNT